MTTASPRAAVDVSVVLPFRNAEATIRDQLEALAGQAFAGAWEVIAVDNRSDDASRAIAEAFAGRLDLRVVDAPDRLGGGYACNVGARHARADKLVFVDADDVVAPGYLAAMAEALEGDEFVMSAFDYETLNPEWVRSAHGPLWRDEAEPLVDHFGVLPSAGGSIGIKRDVFDRAGGFPDDLPRMYDIAMSWEVQFGGTTLAYVPEAVYRVRFRGRLRDLLRQGFAGASCAPLLYKRYRDVGMNRRSVRAVVRSWARLGRDLARARTRTDLAPLAVRLGRELGRLNGSVRHRVFFP